MKTIRAREWTEEELDARSALSKRLGLKPTGRWKGREWPPGQLALLGTGRDAALAKKAGRRVGAVASRRGRRKIPAFSGSVGGGRAWTREELSPVGKLPDREVAGRTGRTLKAVRWRRRAIGRGVR